MCEISLQICIMESSYQCSTQTCAGVSISTVSNVAKTGVTPFCVSTLCIPITVIQFITLTLIDVCIQEKNDSRKYINLPNQLCTYSNRESTHHTITHKMYGYGSRPLSNEKTTVLYSFLYHAFYVAAPLYVPIVLPFLTSIDFT